MPEKAWLYSGYLEATFVNNPEGSAKYWSPVGQPITATIRGVTTSWSCAIPISTDGSQFFRSYEKFCKEASLEYLRDMSRHSGKVAAVTDNVPQHKARIIKNFPRNRDVKVIWPPAATPELSAAEGYRHQSKRDIRYQNIMEHSGKMKHTLSEFGDSSHKP